MTRDEDRDYHSDMLDVAAAGGELATRMIRLTELENQDRLTEYRANGGRDPVNELPMNIPGVLHLDLPYAYDGALAHTQHFAVYAPSREIAASHIFSTLINTPPNNFIAAAYRTGPPRLVLLPEPRQRRNDLNLLAHHPTPHLIIALNEMGAITDQGQPIYRYRFLPGISMRIVAELPYEIRRGFRRPAHRDRPRENQPGPSHQQDRDDMPELEDRPCTSR